VNPSSSQPESLSQGEVDQTNQIRLVDRLALRPKEAAEALGLSERKLRELLPELPHVRIGGAVLLPVDGLREWLRKEAKAEQNRVEREVQEILGAVKG
jgi:excisionase family DNA binding protein